MCDCGDDGVCGIVVICSLQYLCAIVVCILENVSPSLSFEHDVRTRLWTLQEAGAERERERERESQIVRSLRPTRTRQMMTVSNNQMSLSDYRYLNFMCPICVFFTSR